MERLWNKPTCGVPHLTLHSLLGFTRYPDIVTKKLNKKEMIDIEMFDNYRFIGAFIWLDGRII